MRIRRRNIYITIVIVCSSLLCYGLIGRYNTYKKVKLRWEALSADVKEAADNFNGTVCLVIKDTKRPLSITINPKTRLPSASLVKVPIMACVFRAGSQKRLSLDDKLILAQKDKTGGSGILKNKRSGSSFTVIQLIELMITISDNTAANMLINLLGFDYINGSFRAFGLADTNLSRLMMDMRSRSKGVENFTTAEDTALILEKIYYKRLVNKRVSGQCLEILEEQRSRDRIPAKLPKAARVAHKTGLERGVCHDAGIVFTDNGDFIICVLTGHKNRNSWPSKKLIAKIAGMLYSFYVPDGR